MVRTRLGGLAALIFRWRSNPLTFGLEINDVETISAHQRTIEANPLLKRLYLARYRQFLPSAKATESLKLPYLEIGCGPSHMEHFVPGIIKTDVVKHSNVDQVVDAGRLPYENNSLAGLFLTNVLHHLNDPAAFLAEAERCLTPGGRLVMVEPSNSWLLKLVTNSGSPHEYCDDTVTSWHNEVTGRLSHANNSLPWIIFIRDRKLFESRFPRLRILTIRYHTLFAFYLSGGFNYRPFLPTFFVPLVEIVEWLGRPLCRWMGFEITIVVEKH